MPSVRRIVHLLLAVQVLGAAVIAYALWRWGGVEPWRGIATGALVAVGARLAISLNNFAVSARHAAPAPEGFALGRMARLRMFCEEFASSMLQSSWLMARAAARTRIYPGSTAYPVLLLHGYGCNSGFWAYLTPLLDQAHISHATLDLEPVTGSIDGYAGAIEHAAQALCTQAGSDKLIVVAHSMGGLAARAWMRAYGTARVAHVITLGTPHHGTALAAMGIGLNAAQMRRDGDWLRELAASESPATRALVTSIFSWHDNIVSPQSSSELEGARNIGFGGIGHVALGSNARILAAVMGEIDRVNRQRATRQHEA
ncbi:MAG TPA: alpha/beta fold hydrolase [Telluria sp.]|nr:alpha/beta fold hydrolase [Telluria sp.]